MNASSHVVIALALAGTLSAVAAAQTGSTSQAAAFDRLDRESRTAITQFRCAQRVARLRAAGVFGPADSLGGLGQCMVVDGKYVGVYFSYDSAMKRVTRVSAVDLTTSRRRTEPLDTTALGAMARATRYAYTHAASRYEKSNRQFAPMGFWFDGDSIEVWMIPAVVFSGPPFSVGGEMGFVFAPNGAYVRTVDAFDSVRPVALADTGTIHIPALSSPPGFTDMMLANGLHDAHRAVAIDMPTETASLVGAGQAAMWMRVARKP